MNYHYRHKYIDANTSATVDIIIACAPNCAYLSSIISRKADNFSFIPAKSFFLKIDFFKKKNGLYRIALAELCLKVRIITPKVIMQSSPVNESGLFAVCSRRAWSPQLAREITVWSEQDDHFKTMTSVN